MAAPSSKLKRYHLSWLWQADSETQPKDHARSAQALDSAADEG
jgi:hypothetical protein